MQIFYTLSNSLVIILCFSIIAYSSDKNTSYLTVQAKKNDAVVNLLNRYGIPDDSSTIQTFFSLNKNKFTKNEGLVLGKDYKLPVLKKKYNGKSIRSSIGIKDYELAKAIEKFNLDLSNKGLIKKSYKKGGDLLVPQWLIQSDDKLSADIEVPAAQSKSKTDVNLKGKGQNYPIFGKKYSLVKNESNSLSGFIFYIDSGHGGPDPGAIGKYGKKELHEDEYAYDVSLRLARKLIANGAEVHIIVQDPDDGIRDEAILKNDSHEFYLGGDTIAFDQLVRLTKRADIINQIYEKYQDSTKQHISVTIHLDSRSTSKRVDVFFYHAENSDEGKKIAETLQETFRSKYMKAQPGRGYSGSVSSRDLFMLREVKPTSIYIELGNIQNLADQQRFIVVNNRQAVANWLYQGFLNTINQFE